MYEKIELDKENKEVTLEAYYEIKNTPTEAILVIPGGGYGCVCADREGGPIANAFLERGINAFVLTYRVAPNTYPAPLVDAARGMAYIRKNFEKYGVDPDRIYVVGFSAGGHLTGLISTQHGYAEKLLSLPENFARPTASVYAYPVVSTECPTHGGSFINLSGKKVEELSGEERRLYSIECSVTENTPPAFIWHTAEDEIVPPIGSLRLAEHYMKAGVPVTLHLYPYGPHGVALADERTVCDNDKWIQPLAAGWVDYAVEFFKSLK